MKLYPFGVLDAALVVFGLLLIKQLTEATIYLLGIVVLLPLSFLLGFPLGWDWGDTMIPFLILGLYLGLWFWRWSAIDGGSQWMKELAGRFLDKVGVMFMAGLPRGFNPPPTEGPDAGGRRPTAWRLPRSGHDIIVSRAYRDTSDMPNLALERLMGDLLSNAPEQGWLAEIATSLYEQARAGRLRGNMERIVAILEQEKIRLQHLSEINKLSGQLSQADLAREVEEGRIVLERLKLEHEAKRAALEMSELVGLKPKEQVLREKKIELEMARVQREIEELERKPEPPVQSRPAQPPFDPKEAARRILSTINDLDEALRRADQLFSQRAPEMADEIKQEIREFYRQMWRQQMNETQSDTGEDDLEEGGEDDGTD